MVTLREWWTERWQSLAPWQRALGITIFGGPVFNRGLPVLGNAVESSSLFSRIAVVGVLIVGFLFVRTRKRLVGFENRLKPRVDTIVGLQYRSLSWLEHGRESTTDATPDGGRVSHETLLEWVDHDRRTGQTGGSTASLFAVALLGNAAGLLLAVEAGLGRPGSFPVVAVSILGGVVAVGASRLWDPGGRPDRRGHPIAETHPGLWTLEGSLRRPDDGEPDDEHLEELRRRFQRLLPTCEVEVVDDGPKVRPTDGFEDGRSNDG